MGRAKKKGQKVAIKKLCEEVGMSRQNYYKERRKRKIHQIDAEAVVELVNEQRRDHPRMGVRKVYKKIKETLKSKKIRLGRDKLFALLRERGLLVKPRRRATRTTHSRHNLPIFRNLVKNMEVTGVNQVWNADITYLRVGKGFMYLALVSDQYSRKILGYDCSCSLESVGCQKALQMALKSLSPQERPIHHSDRGCQYCCHEYVKILNRAGLAVSMTEQNHCYENAYAERLNGILKDEYALGERMVSEKQALKSVRQAVLLYNNSRLHQSLGYRCPTSVHEAA